jgi:hypothetical protein
MAAAICRSRDTEQDFFKITAQVKYFRSVLLKHCETAHFEGLEGGFFEMWVKNTSPKGEFSGLECGPKTYGSKMLPHGCRLTPAEGCCSSEKITQVVDTIRRIYRSYMFEYPGLS